jgi:hypothetical protein
MQHGQDKGKSGRMRGGSRVGGSVVEQRGARRGWAKEGHKETLGATRQKKGTRREPLNGELQSRRVEKGA